MEIPSAQLLEVSNGHLSNVTQNWLKAVAEAGRPITVAQSERGWFISAFYGGSDRGDIGLPVDLRHILAVANMKQASYVCFDEDGPKIEGLPFYAGGNDPVDGESFIGESSRLLAAVKHPTTKEIMGQVSGVDHAIIDYDEWAEDDDYPSSLRP
jgi:hypothetical protein